MLGLHAKSPHNSWNLLQSIPNNLWDSLIACLVAQRLQISVHADGNTDHNTQ